LERNRIKTKQEIWIYVVHSFENREVETMDGENIKVKKKIHG